MSESCSLWPGPCWWGWGDVLAGTQLRVQPLGLSPQHLAAQKTYNNLDVSVGEALRQRSLCLEGVLTCYPHETMEAVIDRITSEQVGLRSPQPKHPCLGPLPPHRALDPVPGSRT